MLLDVRMSGFDGFDTAAMIRGRTRTEHVPIIFLTAYGETSSTRTARSISAPSTSSRNRSTRPCCAARSAASSSCSSKRPSLRKRARRRVSRDVCIAVLGHDLRNPLNAVQMAATMLARATDLSEKHRSMVAHINAASSRMERLIDNVLDFARGELGGGMSLPYRRRQPDEHRAPDRGRDPRRSCKRTIELIASGDTDGKWDAARIGQLISNLVGNAVQHCADGPVVVEVAANSSHGTIAVTNRGVIPADSPSTLVRAISTWRRRYAGAGARSVHRPWHRRRARRRD